MRLRSALLLAVCLFALPAVAQTLSTISLVAPLTQVTHTATQNGSWSSPQTWGNGIPPTGSRVRIPEGILVTVDQVIYDQPFWALVEGTLRFTPSVETGLTLESLFVRHGGKLEIGLATDPVTAKARLTFKPLSGQAIEHMYDPFELSRGLVSEGIVAMYGRPKTPWLSVSAPPPVGSLTIPLDAVPVGWQTGDQIVYSSPLYDQHETFTITAVQGNSVLLDHAIQYPRPFPKECAALKLCQLHVGNLTRNIRIETDPASAGDLELRAHVMLMHQGGHQLHYVEFVDLGRTSVKPVTDPLVAEDATRDPSIMPLCGVTEENVRGRYAVHFHRAEPTSALSVVVGIVMRGQKNLGNKGGLINHSSNVSVRDAVSVNIDGAHFVTEEGDEVGDFTHNLAIHSKGSNIPADVLADDQCTLKTYPLINARRRLDAWHEGVGGWLNGGGVVVDGNVFAGHSSEGLYAIWSRPLNFRKAGTFEVLFPTKLLREKGWTGTLASIEIEDVPFRVVGNTVYGHSLDKNAQQTGYEVKYSQLTSPYPNAPRSVFADNVAWNVRKCVVGTYTSRVAVSNLVCIQGAALNSRQPGTAIAIAAQGGKNHTYTNIQIYGFQVPLVLSPTDTATKVTWNGKPYP